MTSPTAPRPAARRGLGRGLGSLIPSGPLPPEPAPNHTEPAGPPPPYGSVPADVPDRIPVDGTAGGDPGLTAGVAGQAPPPAGGDEPGASAPNALAETGAGGIGISEAPRPGQVGGPQPREGHSPSGAALLDSADWIGRIPDPPTTDRHGEVVNGNGGSARPAVGTDAAGDRSPGAAEEHAHVHSDASPDGDGIGGGRQEAAPTEEGSAAAGADGLRPVAGAYFAELPVDLVAPNPRQPREVFDEETMTELAHSIREVGLLQPVVVRRAGEGYELVMGERRWRASRAAGLDTIPAIVRNTADDELLRDALLENLHRAQLNPLEEAAAYQQLLDDFGCTHEELATRIGRSRPQISNTLRLLKLTPPVQRRLAAGVLSAGHARTLLAVADETSQERLADRVVAEGISVRGLEELVAVGDLGSEKRERSRRPRPSDPSADHLAEQLSDLYDTRVKIELGRSKGRITIEFASLSDLERIVAAMDPGSESRHVEE